MAGILWAWKQAPSEPPHHVGSLLFAELGAGFSVHISVPVAWPPLCCHSCMWGGLPCCHCPFPYVGQALSVSPDSAVDDFLSSDQRRAISPLPTGHSLPWSHPLDAASTPVVKAPVVPRCGPVSLGQQRPR